MNGMLNCVSAVRMKKEKRILYLFSVPRYKRSVALRLDAQKDLLCSYFHAPSQSPKNFRSSVEQIFASTKGRKGSLLIPRKYDSREKECINKNLQADGRGITCT